MVKKLITFSFAPESIGGFCCICNGVQTVREKHFSACIPMTKHAFLEALKDRIKFNDLLGIDIREGWQNALKDAIEPFVTMTDDCDPEVAAKAVAQADINVRGEEAVTKDMEALEKDNEKLDEAIVEETKKESKKKAVSKKVKAKKEVVNEESGKETVGDSSAVAGSATGDELPADSGSTSDNA